MRHIVIPSITSHNFHQMRMKRPGQDGEKVRTTLVDYIVYDGVKLESRYHKETELQLLINMMSWLHSEDRAVMLSVFCDSKHGNFGVELKKEATQDQAEKIADKIDRFFRHDYGFSHSVFINRVGGLALAKTELDGEMMFEIIQSK